MTSIDIEEEEEAEAEAEAGAKAEAEEDERWEDIEPLLSRACDGKSYRLILKTCSCFFFVSFHILCRGGAIPSRR